MNIKSALLVVLFALCSLSCAASSTLNSMSSAIDAMLADYTSPRSPGASISIIKEGRVLYAKAYGLADVELRTPTTNTTNYRLASVTKQFTATAVLKLVDQGKLSLDSRLTDVLAGALPYARDVRIRHLLNHTSGLVDYEDFVPDTQTVQVLDADVLRLLSKIDTMYFPAGGKYRYSNSGYALLALVVESVSGQPFAAFLKQNIFEPLGMNHTVAFQNGISTVDNRAFGHSRTDKGFVRTDQSNTSAVLGDGGIYSSVEDLFKWDQELYANRLVSASLRQQSFTPGILNDGTHTKYGFGWNIEPYKNIPSMYHTGSTRGFRNAILRFPDQRLTIIILTNRNEGEPIEIARKIADLMLAQ
ncbi:MAG: serine hydrolase domain-containing protein [Ignavibacteria bacterium]|nr:serine hydrolase domain-containing protein [Ignavibacteria bacterium]